MEDCPRSRSAAGVVGDSAVIDLSRRAASTIDRFGHLWSPDGRDVELLDGQRDGIATLVTEDRLEVTLRNGTVVRYWWAMCA